MPANDLGREKTPQWPDIMVPAESRRLIEKFYDLVDTQSEQAFQDWVALFTTDGLVEINLKRVQGHDALLQERKVSWEKIRKRKHNTYRVYTTSPSSNDLLVIGRVDIECRNGQRFSQEYTQNFLLAQTSNGQILVQKFQAWIVGFLAICMYLITNWSQDSAPLKEALACNSNLDGISTYTKLWKQGTDPYNGKWPGPQNGRAEQVDGMLIEWDVPVTLRDGVQVFVDTFRPEKYEDKLPIIFTYSSYGKHGPKTFAIFPNSGVPPGSVSKYAVWEGPDPLYWTSRGYAVINADSRGSWASEGNLEILSPQEALDGHDIIEWAAGLPWSNGKVGMCGVSYLAIIQWRVAETNPPHLSCIMPWEGYTDVYRDYSHHGGIPETQFVKFTEWSCQYSLTQVEDWVKMHHDHHLYDDYQASKAAKLSKIQVPALVVADWGDQGLHTRGALTGFSEISSTQKWLDVHGRKKWQYFYQQSSLDRQEAFFQKFLKEQQSEVDLWPPVQIHVRDSAGNEVLRAENEWPPKRTKYLCRYLDNCDASFSNAPVAAMSVRSYESKQQGDHLTFHHKFDQETELTGSMRLRLWVSTAEADDMDIFVQLDKLDVGGNTVPFIFMSMIDNGPMALGWLRVSHREHDAERSTIERPWLLHKRELKLRPQEIVPCDIEIWPSSTIFHRGESLRVTLQGSDIFKYELAQAQLHQDSVNSGKHFIYTGGVYDSYIVLPVIDGKATV